MNEHYHEQQEDTQGVTVRAYIIPILVTIMITALGALNYYYKEIDSIHSSHAEIVTKQMAVMQRLSELEIAYRTIDGQGTRGMNNAMADMRELKTQIEEMRRRLDYMQEILDDRMDKMDKKKGR